MMYIKSQIDKDERCWRMWHVGDPVPDVRGPVVDFQADGHELQLILDAMGGSRVRAAHRGAPESDIDSR